MSWPEIEPTTAHLTYLLWSFFLVVYGVFSELIRNRAHLSEPPLATLVGIIFGPRGLNVLDPFSWGWEDPITQELTRIIVGVQVFAVGVDLPAKYMKKHWRGIAVLIGPNMVAGWIISATIVYLTIGTSYATALIVAACLTPTDPVLSASVLGEAHFSQRLPLRIRQLLSAESGCNDGSAFPFLYAGLYAVMASSPGEGIKDWLINSIIWQCTFGILVGGVIGLLANRMFKYSEAKGYPQQATLFVSYFLLAIFTVGVGSTLGMDDFLVAFSAGTAFGWDGWFSEKTHKMKLPSILDLLLNSTMFIYFGSIIPWQDFHDSMSAWWLTLCTILILLLRRIPPMLAMKRLIPEIKTWNEALFCGHFGPMGVGAIFLAMEARARLETGTSKVLPHPPHDIKEKYGASMRVWPIISFVVLWSIMIHGFSALAMSIVSHFMRPQKERAPLLANESDRLYGMANEAGELSAEDEEE